MQKFNSTASRAGNAARTISEADLISRFDRARPIPGKSAWMACCPAHDDKSPSLSIKRGDRGGWIFHCFAGCSLAEILAGAGLDIGEIMPDRASVSYNRADRQKYPRLSAWETFPTVCYQALVLHTLGTIIRHGGCLNADQWARFDQAMTVIGAASNEVRGL